MRISLYLSVLFLCACGGGGGDNNREEQNSASTVPPHFYPPTAAAPNDAPESGYFVGLEKGSLGEVVQMEMILASDGQVRVFVSDYSESGTGEFSFAGSVDTVDPSNWSPGVVIGENCARSEPTFGCGHAIPGEIRLTPGLNGMLGTRIRWVRADGTGYDSVALNLHWPTSTYRDVPATLQAAQGTYEELLADFAEAGDVVTTLDAAGNLFFQSPTTGCTGNGTLTPYGDGSLNLYSVDLVIDNCDGKFAYLNTSLEGLATRSVGEARWGDWLMLWLSSPPGAANDVALTMWQSRM